MLIIPAFPGWQELHPAIVHFPIALLLIAPLFIAIGVLRRSERGRPYLLAALFVMVLGTASIYVATATGDVAKEAAESNPRMETILEQHEELAETTQVAFSALTLIYAAILFGPQLVRRPLHPRLAIALPIAFVALYTAGLVLLVNTAHQGGVLVHGPGVSGQASSSLVDMAERD